MTPLNQIHWENLKVGSKVLDASFRIGAVDQLHSSYKDNHLANIVSVRWKDCDEITMIYHIHAHDFMFVGTTRLGTPPLSEIAWSDLKVGDRLLSAVGNLGTISALEDIKKYRGNDPENLYVDITWDHTSQKSYNCHCWLDAVTYLGREGFSCGML